MRRETHKRIPNRCDVLVAMEEGEEDEEEGEKKRKHGFEGGT